MKSRFAIAVAAIVFGATAAYAATEAMGCCKDCCKDKTEQHQDHKM
ncbi:hypothetical protein [Sphingomonas alba]|uniref:Uncharacterized protein n=1 Tax=Sphingomonas alba TaxID=2908208 RepID=A0ABT0RPM1_9SPHN|nr:hypothetical protein [Sphingomonas alba]MCL6684609.1 hypothetical protein [Sphingomonas alba]